ncbi:MAG: LysR family transcriptional regulator [Bdellovibrionaceae bacterium]|nr:LysR family transcriptional regulator [Pseudobdellovibrionaceae bacterium]
MIHNWLTLRDLQYVIAVAKHEHFGRAAKECHISQPSLSTQIKKIEDYLGVALFERTNRRVSTTSAGRKMAVQALIIMDEAQKIPALLGEENSTQFKTLKLGVIASLSPYVPFAIADVKKAFPKTSLSLHEGTTENLLEDLKSGTLDAVIAADTVDDPTVKVRPLFFEPFLLAAPKGHAILQRAKLKPSDLNASDMVLLEEGHCLREQTVDICPVNRRGNIQSFHANSIETLRHLVASGAGYTLLPELATKDPAMKSLISYVRFENAKVGREIVLLCRRHSAGLPSFQGLHKALSGTKV